MTNWEFPGCLAVKDLALSVLWLIPGPGISACMEAAKKKKKKNTYTNTHTHIYGKANHVFETEGVKIVQREYQQ